ncbi:hypothetical protein NE237_019785 [Protea cynaroides]|uniref:Uncharacterized protein n=1 Tax=Protea cynaroides TaxID=273540 RepID=A0A9Q0H870_9MAGN|nr:hypothetical protein NE237_019785 [Protea cynaroides]
MMAHESLAQQIATVVLILLVIFCPNEPGRFMFVDSRPLSTTVTPPCMGCICSNNAQESACLKDAFGAMKPRTPITLLTVYHLTAIVRLDSLFFSAGYNAVKPNSQLIDDTEASEIPSRGRRHHPSEDFFFVSLVDSMHDDSGIVYLEMTAAEILSEVPFCGATIL